jgi:hypothetical protein
LLKIGLAYHSKKDASLTVVNFESQTSPTPSTSIINSSATNATITYESTTNSTITYESTTNSTSLNETTTNETTTNATTITDTTSKTNSINQIKMDDFTLNWSASTDTIDFEFLIQTTSTSNFWAAFAFSSNTEMVCACFLILKKIIYIRPRYIFLIFTCFKG